MIAEIFLVLEVLFVFPKMLGIKQSSTFAIGTQSNCSPICTSYRCTERYPFPIDPSDLQTVPKMFNKPLILRVIVFLFSQPTFRIHHRVPGVLIAQDSSALGKTCELLAIGLCVALGAIKGTLIDDKCNRRFVRLRSAAPVIWIHAILSITSVLQRILAFQITGVCLPLRWAYLWCPSGVLVFFAELLSI